LPSPEEMPAPKVPVPDAPTAGSWKPVIGFAQ
jgi:hypothetical protein